MQRRSRRARGENPSQPATAGNDPVAYYWLHTTGFSFRYSRTRAPPSLSTPTLGPAPPFPSLEQQQLHAATPPPPVPMLSAPHWIPGSNRADRGRDSWPEGNALARAPRLAGKRSVVGGLLGLGAHHSPNRCLGLIPSRPRLVRGAMLLRDSGLSGGECSARGSNLGYLFLVRRLTSFQEFERGHFWSPFSGAPGWELRQPGSNSLGIELLRPWAC